VLSQSVETTNNSAAWFALAGTLGAVILTGAVTLTTTFLTQRGQREVLQRDLEREKQRELRQDRRQTYQRFWIACNDYMIKLEAAVARARHDSPKTTDDQIAGEASKSALPGEARAAQDQWWEARISVMLIGGKAVIAAEGEYQRAIQTIERIAKEEQRWPNSEELQDGDNKAYALMEAMKAEFL
jgi:hypothetical protein